MKVPITFDHTLSSKMDLTMKIYHQMYNLQKKRAVMVVMRLDHPLVNEKSNQYDQSILWIHQSHWQKQLLKKYGNTVSLIDATYKTTKYDLFFICVKTNVGYSVVAEFVVQSETAENITESLTMLKQWKPTWKPTIFYD